MFCITFALCGLFGQQPPSGSLRGTFGELRGAFGEPSGSLQGASGQPPNTQRRTENLKNGKFAPKSTKSAQFLIFLFKLMIFHQNHITLNCNHSFALEHTNCCQNMLLAIKNTIFFRNTYNTKTNVQNVWSHTKN